MIKRQSLPFLAPLSADFSNQTARPHCSHFAWFERGYEGDGIREFAIPAGPQLLSGKRKSPLFMPVRVARYPTPSVESPKPKFPRPGGVLITLHSELDARRGLP